MKALVVDDDRVGRTILRRMLADAGVDTIEATDGLLALAALERDDPDFMILDLNMPVMGGAETLAAIRHSPVHSDLPVMCITGGPERETLARIMALGVQDVVAKPMRTAEFVRRLRRLIERATRRRLLQGRRAVRAHPLLIVNPIRTSWPSCAACFHHRFEVLESTSSAHGAILYRDALRKPSIVCVAEHLALIGEDMLVELVRRIAEEQGTSMFQEFFLLASQGRGPGATEPPFSGTLRRLDTEPFLADFCSQVLHEDPLAMLMRAVLVVTARDAFLAGVRDALGSASARPWCFRTPSGDCSRRRRSRCASISRCGRRRAGSSSASPPAARISMPCCTTSAGAARRSSRVGWRPWRRSCTTSATRCAPAFAATRSSWSPARSPWSATTLRSPRSWSPICDAG